MQLCYCSADLLEPTSWSDQATDPERSWQKRTGRALGSTRPLFLFVLQPALTVDRYFLLITAALHKLEWHISQIFSPAKHLSHLHGLSNVSILPLVILRLKMAYSVGRKLGETNGYKNQSLWCFFVLPCVSVETVIELLTSTSKLYFSENWLNWRVELKSWQKSYFLAWGALRGIPRFKSKETTSISTSEASSPPNPIYTFPFTHSLIPFPLSTLAFIPPTTLFFFFFTVQRLHWTAW